MKTIKKKLKSLEKGSLLFAEYDGNYCGMNDKSLLLIVSILSSYPERPYDSLWPDHEKEEVTFSKWALTEMLDLIWDHPWELASETVWNFEVRCRFYIEASVTDDQKRIFTIAAQTANDLFEEIKRIE